jgi:hypothetical protein
MPTCVADTDPTTPELLDPSCTVTQFVPQGDGIFEESVLTACRADGSLPDGRDVCYVTRTGGQMHEDCIAEGWNLEFVIVRRDGIVVPGGTGIEATCELSQSRAVDCPGLM